MVRRWVWKGKRERREKGKGGYQEMVIEEACAKDWKRRGDGEGEEGTATVTECMRERGAG